MASLLTLLTALLGLLPGGTATAAAPSGLSDRASWGWAQSDITSAVSWDIFAGYPDGTFGPNRPITRAEGITAVVRMLGLDTSQYASGNSAGFVDVAEGAWYAPAVDAFTATNILQPGSYVADKLHPDAPLTRAEFATWAGLLLQREGVTWGGGQPGYTGPPQFTDLSPGGNGLLCGGLRTGVGSCPAYVGDIELAGSVGIVNGYPDGSFRPFNTITRAEAAATLVRLESWLNASAPSPGTLIGVVQSYLKDVSAAEAAAPAGTQPDLGSLAGVATAPWLTGPGGLQSQLAAGRGDRPPVLAVDYGSVQGKLLAAHDTLAEVQATAAATIRTAAGPDQPTGVTMTFYLRLDGGQWRVSAVAGGLEAG